MAIDGQMRVRTPGQFIVPFVCLLIIAMDLTAGILGIEAEVAQNKVQNLRLWVLQCRDPSYQAFKLGVVAVVLLVFAHTIANLFGGCHVVYSRPELDRATSNKQFAMTSLVLSWITLIIGFILLIAGVMHNSGSRKSCGVSNHRYFSIGGITCFIHGMFAVSYCISAAAVAKEEKMMNPHGPIMYPHGPMMGPPGPMMGPPGPMMGPPGPMMNPPGPMMNPPGPMMNPPGPMHHTAPSAPA